MAHVAKSVVTFMLITRCLALDSACRSYAPDGSCVASMPQVPEDVTSLMQHSKSLLKPESPSARKNANSEPQLPYPYVSVDPTLPFVDPTLPVVAPVPVVDPVVVPAPSPPVVVSPQVAPVVEKPADPIVEVIIVTTTTTSFPRTGELVQIKLTGPAGTLETLAVPINSQGSINMFDAQIFAEKTLKSRKLIPPLVSETSWTGPFDHDIGGEGLSAAQVESASQCKELCVADPRCKAIQYSSLEEFQEKNCFLFNNQADGGDQFQHFQCYKLAREACNIVTDASGQQMICPPLYQPHATMPGVCNLPVDSSQFCAASGLDIDCDPRQFTLSPGIQWPSQKWAVPEQGAPTKAGSTMKFSTGRWATSGVPTSLCEASCGMLGEIGTSCEAPNAEDAGDRPGKPCCLEWLVNGSKVDSMPELYTKLNSEISLAVTIPAQAGFNIGLAKFLQDLPISPVKRNKLSQALWDSGVTSLGQLGEIHTRAIADDADLSKAIANKIAKKVDAARNKNVAAQGSTLSMVRGQGLFRGVRKMRNIEETMLGTTVHMNAHYRGMSDALLSHAISYTPDYSSSQLTIEASSESKFRSLNKVIMKSGLSTASAEVKNIGDGVGIGDSPNNQANVKMPYQGKSPLAANGTSYERAVYYVEPRAAVAISPEMLDMSEGFIKSLHAVVSAGITARRFFQLYGTHTCPNALLGGWMRFTSVAKGSNPSPTADMKKAVVAAVAASSGQSSGGKASLLEVGKSTNGSNATKASKPAFSVSVFEDWKGGDGQGGVDAWRKTMQAQPSWRVIDRYQEKCIPHWYWTSEYPRLSYHLCSEYQKERSEGLIPYKLVKKNVQCKSIKKMQLDKTTASVQPSLRACGEYVSKKFGKAFFVYADPKVVKENVSHGYVDAGVGPCMDGSTAAAFASVTNASTMSVSCRDSCTSSSKCQGYSVNSTNFCFIYEASGMKGNGTNVTTGAAGVAAYGTCFTKLAAPATGNTNSTIAAAGATTTAAPNSSNSNITGLPVQVLATTTTTTVSSTVAELISIDSEISLVNTGNDTNSSNATMPPENCVAFLEEHSCEDGASAEGAWDFYQAQGLKDICGPPPPGMDSAKHLDYCHAHQYEVLNNYPDRICVDCFKDCPAGHFLNGCGGTSAGTCELCGSCPAGQYRTGCGQFSQGQCVSCPVIEGPFNKWVDGMVPCQFECFPPATPNGNSCAAPTNCGSKGKGLLAHKTHELRLLSLGNCRDTMGRVQFGSELVTPEADCGDKFKPIRWNVEFLGQGRDNLGQWTVRDCDSAGHMTAVDKTLMFHDSSTGLERFTFRHVGQGGYHLLASDTEECIKAVGKPGFQLMQCPDCCDTFVFADQ